MPTKSPEQSRARARRAGALKRFSQAKKIPLSGKSPVPALVKVTVLNEDARVKAMAADKRALFHASGVMLSPVTKSGERVLLRAKAISTDAAGGGANEPGDLEQAGTRIADRSARTASAEGRGNPAIPPAAFEPSAKAKALLRGRELVGRDLRRGEGTYDLAQATALLGISRQAVAERVKHGALLAVPGPANQRCYPAFQFTGTGVLPGLREVLSALPSKDPWFRLNWLVNPDPRLGGRTPESLLRNGETALVVEAARRVGGMGA